MNANAELQLLKRTHNDELWLVSAIDELREKFVNQFIAVKDREVIDSNPELEGLVRSLNEKNENPAFLVIEFIAPKGEIFIL